MSFRNDDDFDSNSYVKVNVRLMQFYAKHPEGRVETSYDAVDGVLIMKASLFRKAEDTLPAATGHAFLERLDGEKVGEYTETVAVGRALALMGFSVEKSIASGEEMNRFKERQEAKKEASAPKEPQQAGRFRTANQKTETPKPAPEQPKETPKEEPKAEVKQETAPAAPVQQAESASVPTTTTQPEQPRQLKASRIFKPRSAPNAQQ